MSLKEALSHGSSGSFQHLNLSDYEDPEEFKIKDIEQYPNRLICYLKLKVDLQKKLSSMGTGCLIDEKYVLTTAHTITDLVTKSKLAQTSFKIEGYIKQGLSENKALCSYRIK